MKLKTGNKKNPGWKRIKNIVTRNDNLKANAVKLSYQIKVNLIYYKDPNLGDRLCITGDKKLLKQVFSQMHDKIGHKRYARAHQWLEGRMGKQYGLGDNTNPKPHILTISNYVTINHVTQTYFFSH